MTKTTLKVFALLAVLSAVGAVSGAAREGTDTTLRDIARYRDWTRVTDKPIAVELPSPAG
jgi:hypothetical protein